MDLSKAKVFIDKINREFTRMSRDPENIARIDVDIMMSYVRELYDACLSDAAIATPALVSRTPMAPPTRKPAEIAPPPAPVVEMPPAQAPPMAPQPVYAPEPSAAAPPPPPVEPPRPVAASTPPPPVPEPHKTAPATEAPKPAAAGPQSKEAEALFEYKPAKELSEKLSEMPISDLKKALSLNDRLLLMRELFGGDASALETALQTLNSFVNFEQAKGWMLEHCVYRFGWAEKNAQDEAKKFIKLVRRRYK